MKNLIGTRTEKTTDFFECPECEEERDISMVTEIETYSEPEGFEFEKGHVTETCTVCGWSRDYMVGMDIQYV